MVNDQMKPFGPKATLSLMNCAQSHDGIVIHASLEQMHCVCLSRNVAVIQVTWPGVAPVIVTRSVVDWREEVAWRG